MSNFQQKLHEIIRVDHAGELGAKVIYDGQIAALKLKKDYQTLELVKQMKIQEDAHFNYFDGEIRNQKIRPTFMQPAWKIVGFALGFLTALIDKKAAMTCTTAVEEVIDEHYQEQLKILEKLVPSEGGSEEVNSDGGEFLDKNQRQLVEELKRKIAKFREEELEHRDIGFQHGASDFKGFKPLSAFIKFSAKFAIALSKRV